MSHCVVKFWGAHIQRDCLKAGIAVFPSESDRSYALHYVPKPIVPEGGYPGAVDDTGQPLDEGAFKAWLESLPTQMVLNPFFTHFIKIDPDTSLPQLESEVQRIFTPDVLASADAFLSDRSDTERQSFSRFRKLMQPRERLGSGLVLPKGFDARGLITATNKRFRGLGGELDGKGKILDIVPSTITIGAAAIDRSYESSYLHGFTYVNKGGAASGSGEITSNEIWLNTKSSATDIYVGTFSASGNVLTCRDSESIGDIATGSKQTQSGLTITVVTGDYWGCYDKGSDTPDAQLELDIEGFNDVWAYLGECIDPTDSQTFTLYADDAVSLYGEGGTAVTEKTSSDTGSGVDAVESLETQQDKTSADTGSGVDVVESLQTPQAKTSSDAGSGTEGTPLASAVLAGSESGSGIEALIARLLTGDESGAAVEDEELLKDLFASELGEGSDRLTAKIEMPTKGGGMKLWT